MAKKRFKKGTRIRHKAWNYQCIIADDEIAVFGRVFSGIDKGVEYDRVDFEELFVVSQTEDDFKYRIVK